MNQKGTTPGDRLTTDAPASDDADTELHDLSDADPDFNVDPQSEEMKKIDDSVERAAW